MFTNNFMKNKYARLVLSLASCVGIALTANAAPEMPLTQFVNPLIGTDPNPIDREGWGWDTGNVFPGAVCPGGMLAWSPDTTHKTRIAGGYWYPDNVIEDFSLTHFSGRGVVCLMDVPFMPTVLEVATSPGANWEKFAATFSHTNESASPGYYRVKLDNGIETELTVTPRTGMARFTFPGNNSPAAMLIRAKGAIAVRDNEVTGSYDAVIGGGKRPFTVYFVVQFDQPFQSMKTWKGDTLGNETKAEGENCGVVLTFDTSTKPVVLVRTAISYISIENAQANLAAENTTWDFSGVRQKTDAMWNTTLNCIQVEGGSMAQKQSFYTALYHCFMHPNILDDANGQYPGMDGKIHSVSAAHHQYQNIPAWDEYRSLAPLMSVLVPSEMS